MIKKVTLSLIVILMLAIAASAAVVGVMFAVYFTGNLPYSSQPVDFTVTDAYKTDGITFSKVGDAVSISAPLYANKTDILYADIIQVTALRTGNLKLENASRTSNGITSCEIQFYDMKNGTAGYSWFPLTTTPTTIGLGTFTKNQTYILQMIITTGANKSANEQIKFKMRMD